MHILLFGATGMVGSSALVAALQDPRVTQVTTLGRKATGRQHAKLTELTVADLGNLGPVAGSLQGIDACIWALGVSSVGMAEAEYRRITYQYTMDAARRLYQANPRMAFLFVSGAGTNTTGRQMWARVKGQTEDELTDLFDRAYMFRPGVIFSRDGIESRTPAYRRFEKALRFTQALFPKSVATDTRRLGAAMMNVLAERGPSRVLESKDINAVANAV